MMNPPQITPSSLPLLSIPQKHTMFDPAKDPRSRYASYGSHGVLNRGSEFGVETDESGESTASLWSTRPNHTLLRPNQYRNLPPEEKTQAIVRGQMELMEMVGRMPESSYELSLKDLVERPMRQEENFMEGQRVSIDNETSTQRREQEMEMKKKNNEKKLQMMNRNESMENKGFLLKMGFPFSNWWSNKNKKKNKLKSMDSKVLPKPVAAEEGGEEWWDKRYVVSAGESKSVGLSTNSESFKSSGRRRSTSRHSGGGCWALVFTKHGRSSRLSNM